MQAVLQPRYLDDLGFTTTGTVHHTITDRITELGAEPGTDVLLHGAGTPTTATETRDALDQAWDAIHTHKRPPQTGLIVLLTPPEANPHAAAARAGLETLSRTLSIEWAQHRIRAVTVHGNGDPHVTAEVVAYLAGPAGAYFSGCAITLRPPTGPRPSSPSASPAPPRTPPDPSPSG
jgi:hypothetical protein